MTRTARTARTTCSIAAGLFLFAGLALAQGSYPDKPITMIVPFPPGGVADTVARPVAESLVTTTKFQASLVNAVELVMLSTPDGFVQIRSCGTFPVLPRWRCRPL